MRRASTDTVLVNLTGGDRARTQATGVQWLRRSPDGWVEEAPAKFAAGHG